MLPLESFFRDLRLAFRGLVRDKGFTATALLTFALCLGANVALFAVVNAVLIRPLPYPNPGQLVTIFNQYPKAGVDRGGDSVPHYLERRAGIAAFADAAAFRDNGVTLGEGGSPNRLASMNATPSFFRVLGVAPALGRTFTDEEGFYAVSYTHLDVYKRQRPPGGSPCRRMRRSESPNKWPRGPAIRERCSRACTARS